MSIVKNFEQLMQLEGWLNRDRLIYLVGLENLQKYMAYYERKVKPQLLTSYLAALRDKHEQLGFLEWKNIRCHVSI